MVLGNDLFMFIIELEKNGSGSFVPIDELVNFAKESILLNLFMASILVFSVVVRFSAWLGKVYQV